MTCLRMEKCHYGACNLLLENVVIMNRIQNKEKRSIQKEALDNSSFPAVCFLEPESEIVYILTRP